ncbi:MAG: hypothetical protein U9N55_03760 [candidate division Zixibacteria bacterium]|nr:hypothetical protein [candidate division Zixibacteria bacterium]
MSILRLIAISLLMFLLVSCGEESSSPTQTDGSIDGASLLGLVDGGTLTYLQSDTVVTPDYLIETSETMITVSVSGSDDDWIISHNNHSPITLKLSLESVLVNSYQYGDSTIYFPEPPALLKREISEEQTWSGYTPVYSDSLGEERYTDIFINYGFSFNKTYKGTELVTVTAGEFDAYRFDVELFLEQDDSTPVANITEYYAKDIGLVKYQLKNAAGLTRVLSLIEHEIIRNDNPSFCHYLAVGKPQSAVQ